MPNEAVSTVREQNKIKDRISLVVCANVTGSHKVSSAFIGKAKTPACIKNQVWPIPYFSQNKAWMDEKPVLAPEFRRRTGQRVLLILNNTPGHFEAFEEDNMHIEHSLQHQEDVRGFQKLHL